MVQAVNAPRATRSKLLFAGVLLAAATLMMISPAYGQNQGGAGGAGGGAGGGRGGRGDPTQQRAQAMEQIKLLMGVSENEWQLLGPKIEKVADLQTASNVGRGGMGILFGRGGGANPGGAGGAAGGRGGRGGRGGGGGGFASANPTIVQQKLQELQALIDNPNVTPEEITARLKAFRDARTHAREEWLKAQNDLVQFLTPRQEMILVVVGYMN